MMEAADTNVTLHFSIHLPHGGEVSPTLRRLLEVIDNTSFAFIDLGQDEARVSCRSRV